MKQTIFPKSRTVRQVYKRVEIAGGFTSEPDGQEEIYYKTEIDLDYLNGMGRIAASNKSGRCVDGALIVTVLSRKKL